MRGNLSRGRRQRRGQFSTVCRKCKRFRRNRDCLDYDDRREEVPDRLIPPGRDAGEDCQGHDKAQVQRLDDHRGLAEQHRASEVSAQAAKDPRQPHAYDGWSARSVNVLQTTDCVQLSHWHDAPSTQSAWVGRV